MDETVNNVSKMKTYIPILYRNVPMVQMLVHSILNKKKTLILLILS